MIEICNQILSEPVSALWVKTAKELRKLSLRVKKDKKEQIC